MKIAVVSNDYLYNNIESFINAVCTVYGNIDYNLWTCKEQDNIYGELVAFQPSILITENLAGFSMSTFMGNTVYNLIHCLQIHLLYDPSPFTEQQTVILKKPLSLSMHFMCCNETKKKEALSLNSDIPFIGVLSSPIPNISVILDQLLLYSEKGTSE